MRLGFFLKWIALPSSVCGFSYFTLSGKRRLTLATQDNEQTNRLLNVQVLFRHGDRTPVMLLRNDPKFEYDLWVPKVSKIYSPLPKNFSPDMSKDEISKISKDLSNWMNVSSRLRGSYLLHRENNYDPNSKIILNTRSSNDEIRNLTSSQHTFTSSHLFCGQLTYKGVNELEKLGEWLRERYVNELAFLPNTFTSDNCSISKLYVQCSNYLRTISSVDSLLIGLYPLNNRSNDNSFIGINADTFGSGLYPNGFINNNFLISYKNALKNPKIRIGDDLHKPLQDKIMASYENINQFFKDSKELILLADCLKTRKAWDYSDIPANIKNDFNKFLHYVFQRRIIRYNNDIVLSYGSGLLLYNLFNNMQNDTGLFRLFSVHDTTLLSLLVCLLKDETHNAITEWPQYGASLIFETYQRLSDNKLFIRILYQKNVLKINNKEYIELDYLLNNCKNLCYNLNDFKNLKQVLEY